MTQKNQKGANMKRVFMSIVKLFIIVFGCSLLFSSLAQMGGLDDYSSDAARTGAFIGTAMVGIFGFMLIILSGTSLYRAWRK